MNKKQLLYDKLVQITNRNKDINKLEKEIQKLKSDIVLIECNSTYIQEKKIKFIKNSIDYKTILLNRLRKLNNTI